MTSKREPTRLGEQLEGAAKGALSAYASQGPRPEQLTRMSDQLMADIARGVSPRGQRPAHANVLWWLASAGLLAVVLAGLPSLRPAVVEMERKPDPARSAPAPVTRTQGPEPHVQETQSERSIEPTELPPTRVASPARRVVRERNEPATTPSDPQAELALLRPARQLLAVKPARSLALAVEHEQRFPQGLFSEERTVIRIETLARLGRRPAAVQAARAFRKLHPTSTYLARVNEIVAPP